MAMQAAGAKEVAVTLVKAGVSHSLATAVVNVQQEFMQSGSY